MFMDGLEYQTVLWGPGRMHYKDINSSVTARIATADTKGISLINAGISHYLTHVHNIEVEDTENIFLGVCFDKQKLDIAIKDSDLSSCPHRRS